MPAGARPGERRGGRQAGTANKRTREIADRAMAEGLTPLEVMLKAMRELVDAGEMKDAAEIAAKAAPYVHPRLASVEMTSVDEQVVYSVSDKPLTDEDWEAAYCGEAKH